MDLILFSDPPQKSQEGRAAFLSILDWLKIVRNFQYFSARFKLKAAEVFHFRIERLSPLSCVSLAAKSGAEIESG